MLTICWKSSNSTRQFQHMPELLHSSIKYSPQSILLNMLQNDLQPIRTAVGLNLFPFNLFVSVVETAWFWLREEVVGVSTAVSGWRVRQRWVLAARITAGMRSWNYLWAWSLVDYNRRWDGLLYNCHWLRDNSRPRTTTAANAQRNPHSHDKHDASENGHH